MRVLVLTSTFPRWADDPQPPFVLELCKRLSAAHDVLVLAPHCRGAALEEKMGKRLTVHRFRYAPERLESLAYDGGILENLRRARWRYLLVPLFLVAEWFAAARAVRRERPDVIHAHWIVPQGLVGLLARLASSPRKRPPLVCTSHGADLFALRGSLLTRLKGRVVRTAAAVTVVSTAMKAEAERLGASERNVRVMPMGVDARHRFLPGRGERAEQELLFVGRLVRKKGVTHLLQALAIAHRNSPGIRLTVIGSGPLEHELREEAIALGVGQSVTFAGAIRNEDLPSHYRSSTALVVPSVITTEGDQEGLGLVIAEALACECPVIASDLPAVRDLVEHGVTGLLASKGDARDLAEKILRIVGDRAGAGHLARQGRALVLERFDWDSVAQGYERLLLDLGRPA